MSRPRRPAGRSGRASVAAAQCTVHRQRSRGESIEPQRTPLESMRPHVPVSHAAWNRLHVAWRCARCAWLSDRSAAGEYTARESHGRHSDSHAGCAAAEWTGGEVRGPGGPDPIGQSLTTWPSSPHAWHRAAGPSSVCAGPYLREKSHGPTRATRNATEAARRAMVPCRAKLHGLHALTASPLRAS